MARLCTMFSSAVMDVAIHGWINAQASRRLSVPASSMARVVAYHPAVEVAV